MVKFREEDLQRLKEEDEALYNSIMAHLKRQEERRKKEDEIANRFWSMVDASENKNKR